MQEKIQKLTTLIVVRQLRDVRVVGFLVFGVLVLLVSYSGVKVIQTNFELEKQVSRLRQENAVAELRNNNLKLTNQYYNTDEYRELVARKQYGKGYQGETLLLVPQTVALQYTIDPEPTPDEAQPQTVAKKPIYQRNIEAWRDLLLNRTISE